MLSGSEDPVEVFFAVISDQIRNLISQPKKIGICLQPIQSNMLTNCRLLCLDHFGGKLSNARSGDMEHR